MTSTFSIDINYMDWFFARYTMKSSKGTGKKLAVHRTLKCTLDGKQSVSEKEYDDMVDIVDDMMFSLRSVDPAAIDMLYRAIKRIRDDKSS